MCNIGVTWAYYVGLRVIKKRDLAHFTVTLLLTMSFKIESKQSFEKLLSLLKLVLFSFHLRRFLYF